MVSFVFSPSDLANFVACPHLTTLQVAVARGELEKPYRHNAHADLIRRKGDEHEAAYLQRLVDEGRDVVRIAEPWEIGWDVAAAQTEQAMRDGREVVYQAAFVDGAWRGLADFVMRQPDGGYEALDTKLARHARPAHVLQLCFYTEQIARIQGSLAGADARRHRRRRARELPARRLPRLLPAPPRPLPRRRRERRARPTRTPSSTAGSATSSRSARSSGSGTTT